MYIDPTGQGRTAYKVLGVRPNENEETINIAHNGKLLGLVREPGVAHDAAADLLEHEAITKAHELLSNPESRTQYNQWLYKLLISQTRPTSVVVAAALPEDRGVAIAAASSHDTVVAFPPLPLVFTYGDHHKLTLNISRDNFSITFSTSQEIHDAELRSYLEAQNFAQTSATFYTRKFESIDLAYLWIYEQCFSNPEVLKDPQQLSTFLNALCSHIPSILSGGWHF